MKNEGDSSHTGLSPPVGIRGVRAGAFLSSEVGTALTAAPRCCRRPPSARQPTPPTPQQKLHSASHVPSTA